MKLEVGAQRPTHYPVYWDLQYELFSHFEYLCGIPHVLFAITTLKDNGKPNVCFESWSSFTGGKDAYYAVMGGLSKAGHTYQNILRTGEFVINFLGPKDYDALIATIEPNADDTDEMAAGGFTPEAARTVSCPRIAEAFLCMECRLEKEVDIAEGNPPLLIGKVLHIAAQEAYARGLDEKHGENGFMFNMHAPKNLQTGEGKASALGVMKIVRINEEG